MSECKYCDEDFSSKKEKLDHELNEHEDEMSDHDKSDKKSELSKIEDKENNKKHERKQKIQFIGIGVLLIGLVAAGGVYAVQNLDLSGSETNESIGVGTPVHWHADYQITVCGEDQVLRGGPTAAHTHGEKTFHLEGTRNNREQATLDWIVDSLGGNLEENSIQGLDNCNGEPANLTVKANGEELENPLDYIVRNEDFIEITYE